MTSEQRENLNYKEGLKATSLFGGVQVYTIMITIVRSKIIALLLGPVGMGVMGLLTSTTGLITSCTNFGLSTSAVRDLSEAHSKGNQGVLSRTVCVFRRMLWLTGLLGMVVCLFLSPYWSWVSFGNYDYSLSFVLLSCTLLFTQLAVGQTALLQGTRHYGFMAKSSLWGSTLGLLLTTPLYFFFGVSGIVPAIILTTLITLFLSWHYSRKVKVEKIHLTYREVFREGRGMARMGFFLALQGLLSVLSGYLVRVYISHTGGLDEVGLYSAGFSIVNTYVGLVFTAMSTEYYPRLSSYAGEKKLFNTAVNQQMEIALLLLSPVICLFLIFGNIAITVLYSNRFQGIDWMLYWTILGIFFKAPSWSIAFSFLAKSDTKAFFWNELVAILYTTLLNILFYRYWGLDGIGVSFFLGYLLYWIQVWIVCKKRYEYEFDRIIGKIFVPHFLLALGCVGSVLFFSLWWRYGIGCLFILLSGFLSYRSLDTRIGIKEIIKTRLKK